MALRSDFVVINFNKELGDRDTFPDKPWAEFVGNQTEENFFISDVPVGTAYLLLQLYHVNEIGHQILINGHHLSGGDITPHSGWQTWMDEIESGKLQAGNNTIQIRRNTNTGDNFIVGRVVVHWREQT